MKIRFLILFLATIMMCGTVMSQNNSDRYIPRGNIYHAEDTAVVRGERGVGWVRAHFFDDWFFLFQGGGQLYYGTDDREGAFKDRLTSNAEFHIGRRIFPMFGFRAGLGFGYAHGFLTKEHYNAYRNNILIHGYSGQCGRDAAGNEYGGYYWDYNDNLLIQKWKYFYFGGDLFLDLALLRGSKNYDPYRRWNNIIYAGVHTKYALSETDTNNHRTEAHIGYIAKLNLSPKWSIYADARLSLIERLFDREWVPEIESAGFGLDPICNLHFGITYKFHYRTQDERDRFKALEADNREERNIAHYFYVKVQDTSIISITDTTILRTRHDTVPTPDMLDSIYWLSNDISRWESILNNGGDGDELDSSLLSLLLPYEQIFFERDKWDILPSEATKIEKMARIMNSYPNSKYILIGSADSKTGTVKRNIFLGHVRADVVYNSLVTEYGIDSSRLSREYQGGILDYIPYELNRSTVILMDHPYVRRVFNEMKAKGQAGGRDVKVE